MAMRAKVTLVTGKTHSHAGRKFENGRPQYLTDTVEIMYYMNQGEFVVNLLDGEDPRNKKVASVKQDVYDKSGFIVTPKAVVVEEEDPILLEGESFDDDEDEYEDPEAVEPDEDDEPIDEEPVKVKYSKTALSKMKKQQLVELCDELGLNANGTSPALIKRILEA